MDDILKRKFNVIIQKNNEGKLEEAIEDLSKLIVEFPNSYVLYGYMGGLYSSKEDYKNAIPFYKKLLDINPRSEAGSTGLFHALNGDNRGEEALLEMKRFLEKYDCKKDNYIWILEDLIEGIDEDILKSYREFIIDQGKKYKLIS